MKEIKHVAVIGAGTMGHGIAQLFASSGLRVNLVDLNKANLGKAREGIMKNLEYQVELGVLKRDRIPEIMANLSFCDTLAEGVKGVDLVEEAVFENLELKQKLFGELEALVGEHVILASNTSSFDINDLHVNVKHKERLLGAHFFHPAVITPCVEVIPSDHTAEQVVETVISFLDSVGKAPARCKSGPGFVANRIQYAMAGEALRILEEGIATAEDIDKIVRTSFGFRLSAYGPMEVIDMAGLDIYDAIWKVFYEKFPTDTFKPPRIVGELASQGKLGLKSGEGFYKYEGDMLEKVQRERDKKLFDRLALYKKESGKE